MPRVAGCEAIPRASTRPRRNTLEVDSVPSDFLRPQWQEIGLDPRLLRLITHYPLSRIVTKKRFLAGSRKEFFRILTAMLLQLAQPEDGDCFVVAGFVVMRAKAQQSGTHSG